MEKPSFTIFKPNSKFILTPNLLMLCLYVFTTTIFWAFQDATGWQTFKIFFLCIITLLSIYFLVAAFFTYPPLNGDFDGNIEFDQDNISINLDVYKISTIVYLDFKLNDYYGKPSERWHAHFNPRLSQGVSNFVTFKNRANQTFMVYFKLENKVQSESLIPFINNAIKSKLISQQRGAELLGVENIII